MSVKFSCAHLSVACLSLFALLTPSVNAKAVSPWITTDRTVDCSSYETIVKGVIKDGMTDEQKAIAMYTFFRQMVYHYRNTAESRNPVKCVNVIGNTLCGSQATCMKGLLAAAGIKARVVSHPGHTFYEAFYDGKWHGYDTMTNFYIFTRGENRNVASFDELNKDPSLITDAVKEGRAVEGICPCGDKPIWFAKKIKVLGYKPRESKWSVKDYSLREGEEIVRSWWPHGRPVPGTYRSQDPGPLHTCGSKDRKNPPALFKLWEPYGIPKHGGVSISYRHYFNGFMNFSPDLSKAPYAEALGKGELAIPVKCPFYITAGTVKFEATCEDGGSVDVLVSVDGKNWKSVSKANKAGKNEYRAVLDSVIVKRAVGRHTYQVKFKTEKAKLEKLYLKTVYQHNAMAAPHLMPGKNKVTLALAKAGACPMTVIYRYKDAPNWTELKTVEKSTTDIPFTFEVDLPETKKLPQMQDMTIRCGKMHWVPVKKVIPNKMVCDFAKAEVAEKWRADAQIKRSHDGTGMLLEVKEAARYPQASLGGLKEDWSEFQNVVIEMENLGPKPQSIVFRARSNEDNKQRTDVDQKIPKGKFVMRIPLSGLKKTKLNAITKIYLMTLGVPAEGCKIRVTKLYLEPKQEL